MFIGHFAAAFAAKRAAPKASLGALVAAAAFLDVLWPIFVATGLERVRIDPGNTAFTPLDFEHCPISHSLAMALIWALLFAGLYWRVSRYRRGAIAAGVLVASHWFLEVIVHRPDLLIAPGCRVRAGFGLWNSVPATLIVEGLLFIAGVWIYARATRPRDPPARAHRALWLLGLRSVSGDDLCGERERTATPERWCSRDRWTGSLGCAHRVERLV
jgi:hypothetical protein